MLLCLRYTFIIYFVISSSTLWMWILPGEWFRCSHFWVQTQFSEVSDSCMFHAGMRSLHSAGIGVVFPTQVLKWQSSIVWLSKVSSHNAISDLMHQTQDRPWIVRLEYRSEILISWVLRIQPWSIITWGYSIIVEFQDWNFWPLSVVWPELKNAGAFFISRMWFVVWTPS